jgi:predicted dithiol-disulfide oxidoreductase (DUF899 family)
MTTHRVVSHEEWIEARRQHLAREKELTRLRDRLSEERRELPWEKVEKRYIFEGAKGEESLADLFEGRHQLVVYHFMFDPSWEEGCKSCSFWMDNLDGIAIHLQHRDVTFVAISRAPYERLATYRRRMGWQVKWLSSFRNDFNHDYHVTSTPEEQQSGQANYNYTIAPGSGSERPGLSVFYRDDDGIIYHTYSAYARGIDGVNAAYQVLDLVPKGRDEKGLAYSMEWLERHDSYERTPVMIGALPKKP